MAFLLTVSCGGNSPLDITNGDAIFEDGDEFAATWVYSGGEPPASFQVTLTRTATGEEVVSELVGADDRSTLLIPEGAQRLPGEYLLQVTETSTGASDSEFLHVTQWDWTQDRQLDLALSGSPKTDLPYYSNTNEISGVMTAADLHPRRGWVLLTKETDDLEAPHFVLYNRFSGTLRLFFYNTLPTTFTRSTVELSAQTVGPNLDPMLGMLSEGSATLSERTEGISLTSVGVLYPQTWNYADFQVLGYMPGISDGARMNFKIKGVTDSEIFLEGKLAPSPPTKTSGQSAQAVGSFNSLSGATKTLSNAWTAYTKSDKALKAARDRFDPSKNKPGEVNSSTEDFLFTALDSEVVSLIPYASAAVPLVKGFFGTGSSAPTVMQMPGSLELKGTITSDSPLRSISIPVPSSQARPGFDESLYPHPLGILAVAKRPTMLWEQVPLSIQPRYDCINDSSRTPEGFLKFRLDSIDVIPNPAMGRTQTIEVAYVPDKGDGLVDFVEPDDEGNIFISTDGFFEEGDLKSKVPESVYSRSRCILSGSTLLDLHRRSVGVQTRFKPAGDGTFSNIAGHTFVVRADYEEGSNL